MDILNLLKLPNEKFLEHCSVKNYQGSGAGGQKRNRKLSGVRLILPSLNLEIKCCMGRNTQSNIQKSIKMMKMEIALNSKINLPEKNIFPGSNGKINQSNDIYPIFICISINKLIESNGQIKPVAELWEISSSALSKIFFADKHVLEKVQSIRITSNLNPLKNPKR